jgi:hypothetical protein
MALWSKKSPREGYARWPLIFMGAAAFAAIWGGWVQLGELCGFGTVNLLPGIADVHLNLAITLPLGMEVYAAYAMGAWLTHRDVPEDARTFARWSAIVALIVGGAGQVAYHLLAASGATHAPGAVTVVVACIPVAVLGMASALAHRLSRSPEAIAKPSSELAPAIATDATRPTEVDHDDEERPEIADDDHVDVEPETQGVASDLDEQAEPTGADQALDVEPEPQPVTVGPAPVRGEPVAAAASVSPTVSVVARTSATPPRPPASVRDRKIAELHAAGQSQRQIAAALGCGKGTVDRALKRLAANASDLDVDALLTGVQ